MIANVYRGEGMRGLLNYLSQKDGAVLLSTNLDGDTPQTFARQVGHVRNLYPKDTVSRPVCHIPLRPAPGEDLTDAQWADAVDFTLQAMGFQESPYVAYLHDHGDGRHLHIATYRVNFQGRLVSDSFDRPKVMAVARELEAKFGLTVPQPRREAPLTRAEFERRLRDPKRADQFDALRLAIDQAASQSDTLRQFLTQLHLLGVDANLKVARQGKLQGITFRLLDDSVVKGSDLGKRYSLASICNRHELRIDNKGDGPILTASELTRTEVQKLSELDLAPDHITRRPDRNTAYWTLPPGRERWFADLVALHLPHRFIDFTDALPLQTATPDVLEARARKADLLQNIAQSPSPVTLSLPIANAGRPTSAEGRQIEPQTSSYTDLAQRLERLSEALQDGPDLPPDDAAELRASYRTTMQESLVLGSGEIATARQTPRRREIEPAQQPVLRDTEIEPAQQLTSWSSDIESAQPPSSLLASTPVLAPAQPPEDLPASVKLGSTLDPQQSGGRGTNVGPALQAAYQEDPSVPRFLEWARHAQTAANPSIPLLAGGNAEKGSSEIPKALPALATDLLAAHDLYTADPTPHHYTEWRRLQAAYERLSSRLDSLPVRSIPKDHIPAPSLTDLRDLLLATQDRHLAYPSPTSEAEWRRARQAYQSAVATQLPPSLTTPSPARSKHSVTEAHHQLHLASSRLVSSERAYLAAPQDREAQTTWVFALEGVQNARTELVLACKAQLAGLDRNLRRAAADLAFYEDAYFRSPYPRAERLWRKAEAAHLRAAMGYEEVRLQLVQLEREPAAKPHRLDLTTRSATRLFERYALEADADRLHRLARQAARSLWAQNPVGRALHAAAHPLRTAIRHVPRSSAFLSTPSPVSRSLAIYAELRAASDRARERKVPQTRRSLDKGDLSTPSLARAVVAARLPVKPVTFSSLLEAVKASRSSEAALLRTYRSYRRGQASRPDLLAAASRTLATRSAVTERIHISLGLPSFRDVRAVLGASRGAPEWIRTLEQAGFSARAIAVSVAEAAPLAAASLGTAFAMAAGRRVVHWTLQQFQNSVRELLREQNEERR